MGLISKFIISVFKPSEYQKFSGDSLGKALLYLFIITIVFSSLMMVKRVNNYNRLIEKIVHEFKMNSPDFKLAKGKLKVDAEMPYVIEDKKDKRLFIVDTTGQSTKEILDGYNQGALITESEFIHKKSQYETRKYSFASLKDITITKEDVTKVLPYLKWASVFIVIFGVLSFWFGKLISALFLAVIGLVIKNLLGSKLRFSTLYKLSIYSLTTPILIKVILNLLNFRIPFFFIIYYGIAIFYLWQAVKVTPKERINSGFKQNIL